MRFSGLNAQEWKAQIADGFAAHSPESPITWLPKHVRFPEGWETPRFDFDEAPHVKGFIERFVMDPTKRKAVLVWATRLMKTTTLLGLLQWKACEDPVPMAALFPDSDTLESSIDDQVYALFERCEPLAPQLSPPWERNRQIIRLRKCRIRLASGGKKSSVSGYPAQWVVKFEHDKTSTRKSSEGDPSLRLDSRTTGFARGVKIMEEGTPAKKTESRAAKMMASPDVQQVHLHVQCPHCKKYQVLHHDQIRWEHNAIDKSEPALAERTAWYECSYTGCRIDNHDRRKLMQSCQWLIEGERISTAGKITGKPKVDSDTMVFGPLSKLYSLLIKGWGTIAAELVTARHEFALGNEKPLEKCYAETLAIPWDPRRRTIRTNDLVERLRCDDHPSRAVVPDWASFLTFTSDVGKIGEEYCFYWMVTAWGQNCRGGIVDWGIWQPTSELLTEWKAASYPCGLMQIPLWGQPAAIDSSAYSLEIGQLCRQIKNCYPLKGDSKNTSVDLYWPGYQRTGLTPRELDNKRKANQYDLLMINSELTQQWRVALTEGRLTSADPGFVSLPADVCDQWEDYEDFLSELTADQLIDGKWQGENNEFGDTLRYARALAQCFTANGKRWGRMPQITQSGQSGSMFFRRSSSVSTAEQSGARAQPFVKGWS